MQAFASAPLDQPQDDFTQPDRDLHDDGDSKQYIDKMVQRGWRAGDLVHQLNRHHDTEKVAGTRKGPRDDGFQMRTMFALPRDFRRDPFQPAERKKDDDGRSDCNAKFDRVAVYPMRQRLPINLDAWANEFGFNARQGGCVLCSHAPCLRSMATVHKVCGA